MKPVRLLLAALSLATLAACGTESITGPSATAARRDVTPAESDTGSATQSTSDTTTCQGTVVVTTDSNGNVVTTCTTESRGPVFGSGG